LLFLRQQLLTTDKEKEKSNNNNNNKKKDKTNKSLLFAKDDSTVKGGDQQEEKLLPSLGVTNKGDLPQKDKEKEKEFMEYLQFMRKQEKEMVVQFSPRPPVRPKYNSASSKTTTTTHASSMIPNTSFTEDTPPPDNTADKGFPVGNSSFLNLQSQSHSQSNYQILRNNSMKD
jgi:hypothetical protein